MVMVFLYYIRLSAGFQRPVTFCGIDIKIISFYPVDMDEKIKYNKPMD